MLGPKLSRDELIAYLDRRIGKLEAIGLSRDAAIAATAAHYGADGDKVKALVDGVR